MKVVEITEKEFAEKIKGEKVVIDCYAPWCGPCRQLSPILDELAEEDKENQFYKLNVEEAEEVSQKYGIMSIPTILFFEKGELKNKSIGLKTKEELKELLK